MKKSFLKNSSVYFLSSLINKGLAILLVPLYTKFLSPSDYGIIDFTAITINLFVIIFSFQLNQAIARYYQEEDNKGRGGLVAFNSLILSLSISILAILFFYQFYSFFSSSLPADITDEIFLLICIQTFFQLGFYLLQSVFRYALRVKLESFLNVFITVLSLSGVVFFVVFKEYGLLGVFYAQAISYSIAFLTATIFVIPMMEFKFNKELTWKLLRFSTPLILSGLSVFVFTYVDRLMVGSFLGIAEMGIYGVGLRVVTFATFIFTSFSSSLIPLTYKSFKDEKFKAELIKIFDLVLLVSAMVFLLITLFSKDIVLIFTSKEYLDAKQVIPILLLSTIITSFSMFFLGLEMSEKTKKLSLIFIIGGGLNLLLNFMLIKPFGILGAAIATLISSLVVVLIRGLLSYRYFTISYPLKAPLKIISLTFILSIIGSLEIVYLWDNEFILKLALVFVWVGIMISIKSYRSIVVDGLKRIWN